MVSRILLIQGPLEIFGDKAKVFLGDALAYLRENREQIIPNDQQATATVKLADHLYSKWRLLSRTEEIILSRLLQEEVRKAGWRTASFTEFRGMESYLMLVLYV